MKVNLLMLRQSRGKRQIFSLAPIQGDITEQQETITQLTTIENTDDKSLSPELYLPEYEKNPLIQLFKANTMLAHLTQQELMKTLRIMNKLLFSIAIGVVILIIVTVVDSYTTNKRLKRIEALLEETQLTAKDYYNPDERLEFVMEIKEELNKLNDLDSLTTDSVYADAESSFTYNDIGMNPKVVRTSDGREYPLALNVEAEGETKFKISADNAKDILVPGKYEVQVELTKERLKAPLPRTLSGVFSF